MNGFSVEVFITQVINGDDVMHYATCGEHLLELADKIAAGFRTTVLQGHNSFRLTITSLEPAGATTAHEQALNALRNRTQNWNNPQQDRLDAIQALRDKLTVEMMFENGPIDPGSDFEKLVKDLDNET